MACFQGLGQVVLIAHDLFRHGKK